MIYETVQNCKNCNLCELDINKIKPFDKERIDKKIIFIGQNPSTKRDADSKIFEYQNVSDKVMYSFLEKIKLTRNDVYFTNLVKCSSLNNEQPTDIQLSKCKELFYEEINEIKPLVIIFISSFSAKNIDSNKIKCPIIKLKHPSYYFRQTGNVDKAADLMYKDLIMSCLNKKQEYNYSMNFINKTISFKTENSLITFFKNINTLKIYNISLDSKYNVIALFLSDKHTFRIHITYHNYCYVKCSKEEAEKYTLTNIPCKKFFYYKTTEIPEESYEKDIHSDYRFIIDYANYFSPITEKELNYMTFDIETNKSVDVINTNEEIISIVYLLDNTCEFLILDNQQNNLDCIKDKPDVKIFKEEKEMLKYFINIFRKCNVITGFNISGFDLIYLVNRAKKLGLKYEEFSPINKVKNKVLEEKDRMDEKNLEIYGVDCIDTMKYAKDKFFIYSLDKPSQYNLDYLGKFLNLGTKVHDARGPSTLWQEDPEKLYEYNIQDVILCRKIEEYMGMIKYLLSFKSLMSTFNLKWSLYNSKIIDFFMLCNYSQKYVFPSKQSNIDEELEGAFVMEPDSGIYSNVAVLDFRSLYPNIIRQFNISYETISNAFSNNEDVIKINNSLYTLKNKQGIMVEVVNKLMFMKENIQEQIKKDNDKTLPVKLNAIKAVINGIYGVSKYKYFRLYSLNAASAVTFLGRKIINNVMTSANKMSSLKVIYGDTDSLFVHLKDDVDYITAKTNFIEKTKYLNREVSDFIMSEFFIDNNYIELEFETLFHKLLMTKAKKKYFGLGYYIKGKNYDILKEYGRGVDIVKKDTPHALRPILKEFLIKITMSGKIDEIKDIIKETKKKIFSLKYNDLLITKQISRELDSYKVLPQHVKAMKYSNEHLKTDFSRSNYKGGLVYIKKVPNNKPKTDVIMLNENMTFPENYELDYEKYFDLFIKNKMILFLDDFKYLFDENESLTKYMK